METGSGAQRAIRDSSSVSGGSQRKSNPLVSIQTTLRRLNGTSVETKTIGGVAVYRLKPGPSLEQAKARAEHLKQLQDAHEPRSAAN